MPINSKGLIDASILPPLLSLSRSLSLSLSFVIHRTRLSYTTIFVSTTRARDNDRDIRFSNLFINARDGAVQRYLWLHPVARKMRPPSYIPRSKTDRLLWEVTSRARVIETSRTRSTCMSDLKEPFYRIIKNQIKKNRSFGWKDDL